MYQSHKTKNGLTFITAPMPGTDTVTVLVMIGTGSKYEDRKNNGVSHFIEHMMFKGSEKRPTAMAISSELDGLGAEYNAFTSKEYTGYYIKTDKRNFTQAVDVLSDMLTKPLMEQEEMDRERGVIIEEINMYEDNPMMQVEDVWEECLYGDAPAGWETLGPKENIRSMTRKDLYGYFSQQYNISNIVVCLAGKVSSGMVKKAEKAFGFPNGRTRNKLQVRTVKGGRIHAKHKATDQAHLALGVHSLPYNHKEKNISKLMAIILGGSMSSRLFVNLRERNGLAYYVRTSQESYTDSGYLASFAGVPVGKIDQALKIIIGEYRRLRTELISKEELQRTKDLICGRSTLQLEASDNIANWYGRQAIMALTLKREGKTAPAIKTPAASFSDIKKISPADIRRLANKIFTDSNLHLAVIGPFKDKKRFEKMMKF